MADVSSTSSSSSSSTSVDSDGHYWGLASGLDVDSIVTGLLADDQAKIDKADQQQQTLEWQQTAYRNLITELNNFQTAYLQLGSSTTMLSSSMYADYDVTSSDPSLVTATATASATGDPQTITVNQSATTAKLTGEQVGGSITGDVSLDTAVSTLYSNAESAETAGDSDPSFQVDVDGVTKSISFSATELDGISSDDFVTLLNNKLDTAFGTVTPVGGGTAVCKVQASADDSGDLELDTQGDYTTSVSIISGTGSDAAAALGLSNGQSNRISTGSMTLGELFSEKGVTPVENGSGDIIANINGTDVDLGSETDTVQDAFSAIDNAGAGVTISYDSTSDTVTLTANQSGASGEVDTSKDTSGFFDALGIGETTDTGQDALVNVDGTDYSRSTNSFTIAGVTYSILGQVSSPQTVNLTLSQDTSGLQTGVENFINAYNTLISDIHTQINTAPNSDYPPLTDAQKADMTSDQITSWNAQADQGMLYNDSTLSDLCDQMREVLYQPVTLSDGTQFSIFDMGITTSDNADDYGKLEIDPTNTDTFTNAINTESNKIMQLFTKSSSILLELGPQGTQAVQDQETRMSTEGLANRLNDLIQGAAGTVNGTNGSLIQMAGTTDIDTYNNTIYNELQDVSDNITDLTDQMNDKKNQLYTEFENLETFMEQANTQSSMISSLSGSSS